MIRIISTFLLSLLISSQLVLHQAYADEILFDIDGDQEVQSLTDGLLLFRYFIPLRGNTLTDGVIGTNATRTPAQIEKYLEDHKEFFDVDGNGITESLTDGLLFFRYFIPLRGSTLTDGVVRDNGRRKNPTDIETFLSGPPTSVSVSTPTAQRCTSRGMATYTFEGSGVTGTGTIELQRYTGNDICAGTKDGGPFVDTLTYSLTNLRYGVTNSIISAEMKILTFGQVRIRRVSIENGIVTL